MAKKEVTGEIERILNEFGEKLVLSLRDSLPREKEASGTLSNSINFRITIRGHGYSFALTMADYYEYVDKGRKPGKQPPIDSIIKWIKDKRLTYDTGARGPRGGKKLKEVSTDMKRTRSLAFMIARKIGKKGIEPTNFYSSVVNENLIKELKQDLAKAMERDIVVQIRAT